MMHVEIQVALNFVISYLYNKLPRRRVNIFGEELEKALKEKFSGHWYPGKPLKGSAFRCLKTGDPIDPVLEIAARESGVAIQDVLENLPSELAVWVDPGEVTGDPIDPVEIATADPSLHAAAMDREVHKTFNPEARVFRPVEVCLASLSLNGEERSASPSPTKGSPTFLPRSTAPLTFTTASFAQTKFGSTKLKTNSKRTNRMSPTEFSNYIKQRALLQQQHNNHPQPSLPPTLSNFLHSPGAQSPHYSPNTPSGNTARSLSPSYYFSQATPLPHHHSSPQIPFQGHSAAQGQPPSLQGTAPSNNYYSQRWSQVDSEPSSPYHHLLVAN
ncbi:protein Tob1-like [Diaphorina citri]|uniref:Protein Tob1-like n=1 Tax=Diaphorina citri TaxID=121845 RepID=A0A3Q0IYQ7_DIACI|nr:protein Tob1-like [Diaphorina citri]